MGRFYAIMNFIILNSIVTTGTKEDVTEITAASGTEGKVSLDKIMDVCGTDIIALMIAVLVIILIGAVTIVLISRKLSEQNRKYEILSHISNEYIYEYYVKEKRLKLYDKFYERFGNEAIIGQVEEILKNTLASHYVDWPDNIIRLPLPEGGTGTFKAINSYTCNRFGKAECIIGKLIDVSEEYAEKEELINKSQRDDLTGLYNASTAKELIIQRIESMKEGVLDAFLLIDCDSFKKINDTQGHLAGNKILEEVALQMKKNYRSTDILGRFGGDEFCVYMKDVPSVEFVYEKARNLSRKIQNTVGGKAFSVSIGICMVGGREPYESIFKKADTALYDAKYKGKAQVRIWGEN